MILASASFSESTSFWGWPIAAAIGGVFVFVGLLMEKLADRKWYSNLDDLKSQKSKAWWGWIFLMIGILVEIGVGFALAANDEIREIQTANQISQTSTNVANIDPRKKPVTVVFAFVELNSFFRNGSGLFAEPDNQGVVGELRFFNSTNSNVKALFLTSTNIEIEYVDRPDYSSVFMQFQFRTADTNRKTSTNKEFIIPIEMIDENVEIIDKYDSAYLKLYVEPVVNPKFHITQTPSLVVCRISGFATLVLNSTSKRFPISLRDPFATPLILK